MVTKEEHDGITPCDKIWIPVYLTYSTEDGIRVDRDMFGESNWVVLRWYEGVERHQVMARNPRKWVDGKNRYIPVAKGRWKWQWQ